MASMVLAPFGSAVLCHVRPALVLDSTTPPSLAGPICRGQGSTGYFPTPSTLRRSGTPNPVKNLAVGRAWAATADQDRAPCARR